MIKKLMLGALAGVLLVGASSVMARVVDSWLVVGLESTSGAVEVESDLCMGAIGELRQQGFRYRGTSHLEIRLAALYFEKGGDAPDFATLFCLANVVEEQSGLIE